MAKQARVFLSRAVKLLTEHVTGPLTSAETDLNTSSSLVSLDQRKEKFGYVRLHFNIPCINTDFYPAISVPGDPPFELPIPFVLPPLQDFINEGSPGTGMSDGKMAAGTPSLDLMEVSFSLDQRDEPACVADDNYVDSTGASATGKLDYTSARYRTKVAVLQKKMKAFGADSWVPDTEVWSGTIDSLNFQRRDVDANPFVWSEIEKSCDPLKSFLLTVSLPDLFDSSGTGLEVKRYAAVNINVQLVFRHRLIPRDTSSSTQNLPTNSGTKQVRAKQLVGANVPSSNASLLADGAGGLQTMMKVMDTLFLRKLRGGYFSDGARDDDAEHLQDDSAYHVMIVPFFNNFGQTRSVTPAQAADLPYVGGTTQDPACHRHVIPVSTPMTIHHVFACLNWANPSISALHPSAADFVTEIGVAMGSGFPRGDNFQMRQIAYRSFSGTDRLLYNLDQIKARPEGVLTQHASRPWDVEIMQIPLVQRAAPHTGKSLNTTQGPPYYVGKTSTYNFSRSMVGGITPGDNRSDIGETFLELRWSFKRTTAGGLAGMAANTSLVGYGGHWLILVGKKHLLMPGGVET